MISRRSLELLTAALTGSFGTAILVSSLRIGVGWTGAGVGPGTFPALAAAIVVAGSIYNVVRGVLRTDRPVLDAAQLRRIGGFFLPAAAFVALIPLLGLHIAAGVYMLYMLWRQRRPWWQAVGAGIATPFVLYSVFDWAFQVELLRGMLGSAVGL
jgi:hypothetical protein